MSKHPAVRGKTEYTNIEYILNNKSNGAKLQHYIDEACRCKIRMLDEKESIKGIKDAAVTELNINPKMFNTLVNLFFNNNFAEKLEESQQIEAAIEKLISAMPIDSNEMERIEAEDAKNNPDEDE